VSLLKQSTQANNLKGCKKNWRSGDSDSSEAEGPDELTPSSEHPEFVSDSFNKSIDEVSADELKKGMRQMTQKQDSKADDKNYEDEITKDLQEFEVVGKLDNSDEAELERDLAML
jgi:hypothetical protein